MKQELKKELKHHEEEALGKAYDARLVRRLWPFVRPQKTLLIGSIALLPVVTALELAQPYLVKVAIDAHITPGRLEGLGWIALAFLGALVGQFIFAFLDMYLMQLIGQRVVRDVRAALYDHVQTRAMRFFDRNPVGRLVVRLTNDPEVVNEMFAAGVIALAGDLVKLLGIVVAMLWIDWRLSLVAFAVAPVLIGTAVVFRSLVRDAYRLVRIKIAQVNAFIAESLSGMRIVQLFTQEEKNFRAFDAINKEHMESNFLQIRYDAMLFAIVELLSSVAVALLLWYGGGQLLHGAVTFGVLVAFIEYMGKFFVPIRDLSAKYTIMQSAMASCERIFQLLDVKDSIAAPDKPAPVERFKGEIEFDGVTFGYDPERPVLRNVSLRIAPGEKIAIVGATGSGKTTLIKLLSRHYDANAGAIRVDGVDVRDMRPRDLRKRIGVVLQDVFLFKGTIASNIALGLPEEDRDRVVRAARAIGADRYIERRKGGFDEPVSAQGANFGAGERQLVSFARALAHDPDILVRDEATSNIDAITEHTIQRGILKLMEGRTSLIIAHRLSTIRHADRIVVFHKGEVREVGTHEELLAMRGVYARLYELQYKDESAPAAPAAAEAP
ncbi:MAG: ABC transporter ATP-binding protein/permease [Candidatus Methylomirabilis sp.]|nr:ABC transporter ATP-binding protein/permease [Deltaproteobacteria bacterium]